MIASSLRSADSSSSSAAEHTLSRTLSPPPPPPPAMLAPSAFFHALKGRWTLLRRIVEFGGAGGVEGSGTACFSRRKQLAFPTAPSSSSSSSSDDDGDDDIASKREADEDELFYAEHVRLRWNDGVVQSASKRYKYVLTNDTLSKYNCVADTNGALRYDTKMFDLAFVAANDDDPCCASFHAFGEHRCGSDLHRARYSFDVDSPLREFVLRYDVVHGERQNGSTSITTTFTKQCDAQSTSDERSEEHLAFCDKIACEERWTTMKGGGEQIGIIDHPQQPAPLQKPPSLLVYTSDDRAVFEQLVAGMRHDRMLPSDVFTVAYLSTPALIGHPWADASGCCACLLIVASSPLCDQALSRIRAYLHADFSRGKVLLIGECEEAEEEEGVHASLRLLETLLGSALPLATTKAAIAKEQRSDVSDDGGWRYSIREHEKAALFLDARQQLAHVSAAQEAHGARIVAVVTTSIAQLFLHSSEKETNPECAKTAAKHGAHRRLRSLLDDALTHLGIDFNFSRHADESPPPTLTPGYLFGLANMRTLLRIEGLAYDRPLGARPELIYRPYAVAATQSALQQPQPRHETDAAVGGEASFSERLPVFVCQRGKTKLSPPSSPDTSKNEQQQQQQRNFDVERYFNRLQTKLDGGLGHVLLYIPHCESTMDVMRSVAVAIPDATNRRQFVVVADRQTMGRGRGGSMWLTPLGCLCFNIFMDVPVDSRLGQSLSFLQHIMAVAMVTAVKSLLAADLPDFPLSIKWPNDVYYGRAYKMGGVLIETRMSGDRGYECNIGAGLNVANSTPTVCVNSLLPESLRRLYVDEVLAETLNKFEDYLQLFENEGVAVFCREYCSHWLHTDEVVSVVSDSESKRHQKVTILGIDSSGYLKVRSNETSEEFTVHDDGNSFDLMKGLIHPKFNY